MSDCRSLAPELAKLVLGILAWLGSQVGELQHYYVSPGFYLWTQGLHNCVDYAFFLFVGIVEGGGEVMATCFDLWGWG